MNPTYQRNAASDFGSESMFESSSKSVDSSLHLSLSELGIFIRHRLREAADDEDGPPMSSVNDIMYEAGAEPPRMGASVSGV